MSSISPTFSPEREAALLVAFVNTRDPEEETDAIADPEALSAWVAMEVGGMDDVSFDAAAHRRALSLREALRALLIANNGGAIDARQMDMLRRTSEAVSYRLSIDDAGELRIALQGGGPERFEGRLLLAIERLQAAGEWRRLKACADERCRWAFFDASRNRSRTWCSMDVCGNRSKTRRYRRRVSGAPPSG